MADDNALAKSPALNTRLRLTEHIGSLLLLIAVVCFAAGANRGVDLTDESYYLLHFGFWQDFNHQLTFFGAYLDGPFLSLNRSIPAIRVFGALILLLSGGMFAHRLHQFYFEDLGFPLAEAKSVFSVGMSFALLFFGVQWTLRVPSYNTLTLVCMLASTAALLNGLRLFRSRSSVPAVPCFVYGVFASIGVFSKPTSGAAMIVFQGALFLVVNKRWRIKELATIAGWVALGGIANVAYIQVRQPRWLSTVVDGITR